MGVVPPFLPKSAVRSAPLVHRELSQARTQYRTQVMRQNVIAAQSPALAAATGGDKKVTQLGQQVQSLRQELQALEVKR